jgi:myo-inositol-1(or 4)-monophosphatase
MEGHLPVDHDVIVDAHRFAIDLASQAGALLRERFDGPRDVEHKGTIDIVTDADRASETLIAEAIRSRFPDHQLLAEEGATGAGSSTSGYRWIVDPLDGTTNFAHRYPHFCTSIALECHDEILVGAVYDPMRDEMFEAAAGGGARLNGRPISVATQTELIAALVATGFPYDLGSRGQSMRLWNRLNNKTQGCRRDGAAALNICYVAAGRLDGYWERPVQPWDKTAACLIASEAGATVTGLTGTPFDVNDIGVTVGNSVIHQLLITEINDEVSGSG